MAESPKPRLIFDPGHPERGFRKIPEKTIEPVLGDDFAWTARDYDSIRLAMLEELAARFPERRRWTPADFEVVLVEALACALDQLSDMADRVAAEAYIETARRPESLRRLLGMIGYDAVAMAGLVDDPAEVSSGASDAARKLELLWTERPELMERARVAGPRMVHTQKRMVTMNDYTVGLERHPVVRRAAADSRWTGSWITVRAAVVLRWIDTRLDDRIEDNEALDAETMAEIDRFHLQRSLPPVPWEANPSYRMILESYIGAYRMAGREVVLVDAVPVGIAMGIEIEVRPEYFQSEIRDAAAAALGTLPGGFFECGRLRFGEDLHSSDIYQLLFDLEGVADVRFTSFKRVGGWHSEHFVEGRIELTGLEIAVCDNDPLKSERGFYHIALKGGRRG